VIGGRRFAYLSTISGRPGYAFGYNANYGFAGLQEGDFGIDDLTWETSTKSNVGLELGLHNALMVQVDIFKERREDIFIQRRIIPETAGFITSPWANFGVVENKGIDLSVEYSKKLSQDFTMSLRGNLTYAKNRIVEIDEPESIKGTNRSVTGASTHTDMGLVALGLFTDDDFIDVSTGQLAPGVPIHTFSIVRPGDIKYQDINGDGVIDDFDITPLGNPIIPQLVYGFGASIRYTNFDVSVFFQGVGKTNFMLGGIDSFIPGSGGGAIGNIYSNVDDRWTPENPSQDVFWPRLSSSRNANNNRFSTWWQRDGSFIRLKNFEIGYTLPKRFQNALAMRNARVFSRGTNLLTFAPFKLWDPEILSGHGLKYPSNMVVSLGIEVGF